MPALKSPSGVFDDGYTVSSLGDNESELLFCPFKEFRRLPKSLTWLFKDENKDPESSQGLMLPGFDVC
jgi:hypothetical protein